MEVINLQSYVPGNPVHSKISIPNHSEILFSTKVDTASSKGCDPQSRCMRYTFNIEVEMGRPDLHDRSETPGTQRIVPSSLYNTIPRIEYEVLREGSLCSMKNPNTPCNLLTDAIDLKPIDTYYKYGHHIQDFCYFPAKNSRCFEMLVHARLGRMVDDNYKALIIEGQHVHDGI